MSNAGRVEIRSGRSGAVLRVHGGVTTNAYFGSSVAVLGDVDGDGVADYAIGIPGASTAAPTAAPCTCSPAPPARCCGTTT